MRHAHFRWTAGLAIVGLCASCAARPPAPPPDPSDPASPSAVSAPAPARPTTLDWRPTSRAIGGAQTAEPPPAHGDAPAVPPPEAGGGK